jgi:HK97 family phage major capsid protein
MPEDKTGETIEETKVGARHSASDVADLQSVHDAAVRLGAMCGPDDDMPMEKSVKASDMLVSFGGEVKALGDGKVGGYLVRFSTPNDPDLEGDFFTKDTDFGDLTDTAVYFHHRMPIEKKGRTFLFPDEIGKGKLRVDDVGVFMEAVIEMRGEYEEAVKEIYQDAFVKLVEGRQFGLSSGTAGHLVDREQVGRAWWIKKWPLGLDASLTPTPAEPRTGIIPLKSLYETDAQANESPATADGIVSVTEPIANTYQTETTTNADLPLSAKELTMAENEEGKVVTPEFDYEKLADMVAKRLDAPGAAKSAPAVIKAENLGDPDPYRALARWAAGGSAKGIGALRGKLINENQIHFDGNTKAALQEASTEGAELVPDDFYPQIVAKRDQAAIARRAGARVIQTSRDVVNIPAENASMANFAVTAEEAAYTENEPTFSTVAVTVYKFTKVIKISEELLEDDATNLDSFLTDGIGRSWALTENEYTLVGTGSGQPQGVLYGGSVGYTFADTNSITAAEIPALYWSLGDPYHDGASWVMKGATAGHLQGLTGNNFQLLPTPYSPNQMVGDFPFPLWNKPVFLSDSMPAVADNNKTIVFGNWNFYGLVERRGLTISRNPYLYQANGQVGIFVSVRFGGAVLQSEAIKWGVQV